MKIEESLKYARELVENWKKKNGDKEMRLMPEPFIDLLNDGATVLELNNLEECFYRQFQVIIEESLNLEECFYRHSALYNGVRIAASTENKIYEIKV